MTRTLHRVAVAGTIVWCGTLGTVVLGSPSVWAAGPTAPTVTTGPNGAVVSTASGAVSVAAQKAKAWAAKMAKVRADLTTAHPPSSVPAGSGPVDHRALAAEILAAGLAVIGVGAFAGRGGGAPRRRAVVALTAATACGTLVPVGAAAARQVSVGWVPTMSAATVSTAHAVLTVAGPAGTQEVRLAGVRAPHDRISVGAAPALPVFVWDPASLSIPALDVDAPIAGVGVDTAGALEVPRQPTTLGWWAQGPPPGFPDGTSVIAGHVDYAGVDGAFAHLSELVPGDSVVVTGMTGPERFTITGVREYAKSGLPWSTLFTTGGAGRLALVTCGGAFDAETGHYADNVVAFALPATQRA